MAETMTRNHTVSIEYATTMTRKLNLTSMTLLPSTVVAAAINAETTIPTNPSTLMTQGPVDVTTLKPHHHVHNVTGYLVEQDELDNSK